MKKESVSGKMNNGSMTKPEDGQSAPGASPVDGVCGAKVGQLTRASDITSDKKETQKLYQ